MRTRMSGGVGAGRAILPATRFGTQKFITQKSPVPHLAKNAVATGDVTARRRYPPTTRNTRKEICVYARETPGFRIQQEVTVKTEDGVRLRSLRWLLFNSPRVARRRTTKLTDRHKLTYEKK